MGYYYNPCLGEVLFGKGLCGKDYDQKFIYFFICVIFFICTLTRI